MTKWNLYCIISDIVLAIVINTSATIITGAPLAFQSWYPYTCAALGTNILMQLALPVPAFGAFCAKPLRRWNGAWLADVFVVNLVYVTGISLTMALVQNGPNGIIEAWLVTYPYLVIIGYITSVVLVGIQRRFDRRGGKEIPEPQI